MGIISHAQNYEDVILWRALARFSPGFYIDVGAQDPNTESVSLAFYENGWRGVHVEPTAYYAALLRAARPDEEVIEAAISSSDEEIELFEVASTGLSTGDRHLASTYAASGRTVRPFKVNALPLWSLLDRYSTRDIHWLKIDVEGMEHVVLSGLPMSKVRPWVLVVESTKANTQELTHYDWEPGVLSCGYQFVYFDGLNRFYLHKDHTDLLPAFGPGPNIFDDFRLSTVEQLSLDNASTHYRLRAITEELAKTQAKLDVISGELAKLLSSRSWKMTAPYRAMGSLTVRALPSLMGIARRSLSWLDGHPKLKSSIRRLVAAVPMLERVLLGLAHRSRRRSASFWSYQPEVEQLDKWRLLISEGKDSGST